MVKLSTARRLGRRSFLAGVGVGTALLVAACGSSGTTPSTSAPAPATAPTAPAAPAPSTAAPSPRSTTSAPQPTAVTRPTAQPTTAGQQQVTTLPREETLVISVSDSMNQMQDSQIMNPFLIGAQRTGWHFAFESLYYYNEWWTPEVSGPPGIPGKNGEIPYLATNYQYNQTYDQLTITLRPNVTWSDGEPFTADDVVYTLTMLRDNAPKLNFSFDMHLWVKDATARDPHTVQITLNAPNPRFMMEYFQWYSDHGFPIVPAHIWKDHDPTTFTNFDLSKGWPVVTGPWKLTYSAPEQKVWDRRDDWWGAKTGFHPLPKMKRVLVLPRYPDAKLSQLLISNQVDATHQLQPTDAQAVLQQNPKVIVRTPDKSRPWGWIASWPEYVGFNDSKPPWNDPEIRWAINHAFDRQQIVDIGFQGDSEKATLPLEANTALQPYYDSVSDLLQKYPIDAHDVNQTARIMQSKGYQKDQGGFWAKNGQRLSLLIQVPQGFFDNYVPIVVEQLRKAGFDAAFKTPSNESTLQQLGQLDLFMNGQQGAVRDPYATLEQFHSKYSAPTGQPAQYPFRWTNKEYDAAVDAMSKLPASDPQFMTLYHRAMEQWIPDLPTIPLVQDLVILPVNTTYWTGWPDSKNPYTMPAFWLRGSATLLINTLRPAGG